MRANEPRDSGLSEPVLLLRLEKFLSSSHVLVGKIWENFKLLFFFKGPRSFVSHHKIILSIASSRLNLRFGHQYFLIFIFALTHLACITPPM